MPQVTVYIREEDIDAWKGVIKKSEFIHNALQDRSTYDGAKIVLREDLPAEPAIRPLSEVVKEVRPTQPPPGLQHEPLPKAPHRYYHTEWDEYVKWTPEDGITQP